MIRGYLWNDSHTGQFKLLVGCVEESMRVELLLNNGAELEAWSKVDGDLRNSISSISPFNACICFGWINSETVAVPHHHLQGQDECETHDTGR